MKEKQNIGSLFDRIAGKYDFLNHLLSLNIDKWWRRKAVKTITINNSEDCQCLDVAIGTGDLAIELARRFKEKQAFCHIIGIDLSTEMMRIGEEKVKKRGLQDCLVFQQASALEMPFADAEMEKCTATKGDLLVCEGGDYGRAAIWNYDFDIRIQNHVHKLRAYEELCTEYFYYLFNFLKSTGQIKGKGIAIQGLSSGALHNLVVPLPPLNEQYRIVEKLYEIIPVWEKYAAASTKLNTLNASFPEMMKKSILQEAVQGKLVPQDPNDEPASVLLEKIAEEKKRLIKEGKIKKDKKEKYIYRRENSWWEVRDSIEVCLDQELPFDIPGTWSWVHLSNICETIFDIDHKMPKAVDKDHGVLFLSAKDIFYRPFLHRIFTIHFK